MGTGISFQEFPAGTDFLAQSRASQLTIQSQANDFAHCAQDTTFYPPGGKF